MTSTIVELRPARPDESAVLSALAHAAKAFWGYPAEVLAGWQSELRITPESIRAQPTTVAEIGNELAGFVQLSVASGRAELDHLWVHPSFMRRGVGRALLEWASCDARARGHAELHIDADPFAEAFYLACGARRVGSVPAPIPGDVSRARPLLVLPLGGSGLAGAREDT